MDQFIAEMDNDDLIITNFKEFLFDIEKTEAYLKRKKKGLTAKKVMTDYLSLIIHLAIERLFMSEEFIESDYFNYFNESNIRYCFVCSQPHQEFISTCFIDSGLIQQDELIYRLSFVTEVEAVAHHLISVDRKLTKLSSNQNYLLCHVSEFNFGVAEIKMDTTESLSTVELHQSLNYGSTLLQAKFKSYLKENTTLLNLNHLIIDDLVTYFNKEIKVNLDTVSITNILTKFISNKFNFNMKNPKANVFKSLLDVDKNPVKITFDELNRVVYLPFIQYITQTILCTLKILENRKLILSGEYGCNPYFIEYLLYHTHDIDLNYAVQLEMYTNVGPFGAVSSALKSNQVEIPFCIDGVTAINEKFNINDDIEDNNMNQDFDFLVGIG